MTAVEQPVDATEVAHVIAQLVGDRQALCDQAAWDLRRLLSHDLARRTPGRLRAGHLGLLLELIAIGGEFITEQRYEAERAARADEQWPASRTLREHYGSWVGTVRTAAIFWFERSGQRKLAPRRQLPGEKREYSGQEVAMAICRCHGDLGAWPTEWEYDAWSDIVRKTAARNPRLPEMKTINKAYGDFDTALAVVPEEVGSSGPPWRLEVSDATSPKEDTG